MLYDDKVRAEFAQWSEAEAGRRHAEGGTFAMLEWGVKRSKPKSPTIQRDRFMFADEYTGADFEDGLDVDIVADIHDATEIPGDAYDAILCVSVLEHVKRPWVAVPDMGRTLKPGGRLQVTTHQTFPIHGYPEDYWRFTREALALLGEDAGLNVIQTSYCYPTTLSKPREVTEWNEAAEAYLNVSAVYEKPLERHNWGTE